MHEPDRLEAGDELDQRRQIRARWFGAGFAIGIGIAFAMTAVQLAWNGWHILPFQLVSNLIWIPFVSALISYSRCPVPRARARSWRHLRLRTRTLMFVIAYIALLFGMGVSTAPLGAAARRYHQKYVTSLWMVATFRDQARKSGVEARQRQENLATLRLGKIPEGLLQSQKDFLRSLDQTATPEYRAYRYGLIADGEEFHGTRQARNEVGIQGLSAYFERLAAKYDRARWRPWIPVADDPPIPNKW
jgi:hypothetical protein